VAYCETAVGTVSQKWTATVKLINERQLTVGATKCTLCEFKFKWVKSKKGYHPLRRNCYNQRILNLQISMDI
jgi:hypothetical protein